MELFQIILFGILIVLFLTVWLMYLLRGRLPEDNEMSLDFEPVKALQDKLKSNKPITQEFLRPFVENAYTRILVANLLARYDKFDLFPKEFRGTEVFCESYLVYWLKSHSEYAQCPDEIVFLEKVTIPFEGHNANYFVYKFSSHNHTGDLIGIVGPMFLDNYNTKRNHVSHSRFKSLQETTPQEEANWVHHNIYLKP